MLGSMSMLLLMVNGDGNVEVVTKMGTRTGRGNAKDYDNDGCELCVQKQQIRDKSLKHFVVVSLRIDSRPFRRVFNFLEFTFFFLSSSPIFRTLPFP